MAPFPSDYYTVPDPSMPSGRRIDFPVAAMPANTHGVSIDPSAYERNDGFSPGSPIIALVPGVDAPTSHLPGSGHVEACLRGTSPIVLYDLTTHQRLACWAEMDVRDPNNPNPMVIVHPAVDLPEGTRVAVALRDLRASNGGTIPAQGDFKTILHGGHLPTASGRALERHIDQLLRELRPAGVHRHGLFLAWDFTVASSANLTSWALTMRHEAFSQLGSGVPSYTVSQVNNFTPAQNHHFARQIIGTFNVPSFLNAHGGPPGSTFHFGRDGQPSQKPGNVQHAPFECLIPRSTGLGASGSPSLRPGRPILYGMGLFSDVNEIDIGTGRLAKHYDLVICSTQWLGLDAQSEIPDASVVENLSLFPTIPDRLQQSMIDALFLARLMTDRQGFSQDAEFRLEGRSLIDTSKPLEYYGNSEGSLMGGAVTAISTQWRRAVLGVPSMDYAILLPRSSDFAAFSQILEANYPDPNEQLLIFSLLEMLFDRGETDGYVENLVAHPLPGTPRHQVLLQMTYGDHQVANVSTEIEARTLGAEVHQPVLRPGRYPGQPFEMLRALPNGQAARVPAALYLWDDTNVVRPPAGDLPPSKGPDPHDQVPRTVIAAQRQLMQFLRTGQVPDVCGSRPCVTSIPLG